MGKRLKQQRRGKGSPAYRAFKTHFKADLQYRTYDDVEKTGVLRGKIVEFVDDRAHQSLLMKVIYENNEECFLLAPEGAVVGDYIEAGAQASLAIGNVLPLYRIPDGAYIFNIENRPGDRGKMVKTPGSYATIVSREGNNVYVKLPSRTTIVLSSECRAQLGVNAGGGRLEKPLMKAGNAFYKYKPLNRLWPRNRGVKMSVYCHPHGGKQHHVGKSTTVSRGAPPGAKVGHIAARMTGRKKAVKEEEGR